MDTKGVKVPEAATSQGLYLFQWDIEEQKKDENEINTTSETSRICVYIYMYKQSLQMFHDFPAFALTFYHPCLVLTGVQAPPRTCQAHVSII